MRVLSMRAALIAGLSVVAILAASATAFVMSLATAGSLAAQQTGNGPDQAPYQPTVSDEPVQAAPPPQPAKPPRHKTAKTTAPVSPTNPDLDTNDQLAPSQMQQQMPAAVGQPTSAPVKPTRPAVRATTDGTASATPAAGATAGPGAAPAAGPRTAAALANSHVVACSGAFSKDSSHLRLAMTFDTKNVTFSDVESSSGSKVPASVLFPTDPKRRLEVWWSNPAARSQTYLIVINGKSTWTGPGGMKLGLTLPQLEKLNHKPFKIKGFGKDGTATVSDWNGGLLATLVGGCKSGLSMTADPKAAQGAISALEADKEYSSDDPAFRAVKPVVSEILIGY
jgi:hypothetical protein